MAQHVDLTRFQRETSSLRIKQAWAVCFGIDIPQDMQNRLELDGFSHEGSVYRDGVATHEPRRKGVTRTKETVKDTLIETWGCFKNSSGFYACGLGEYKSMHASQPKLVSSRGVFHASITFTHNVVGKEFKTGIRMSAPSLRGHKTNSPGVHEYMKLVLFDMYIRVVSMVRGRVQALSSSYSELDRRLAGSPHLVIVDLEKPDGVKEVGSGYTHQLLCGIAKRLLE